MPCARRRLACLAGVVARRPCRIPGRVRSGRTLYREFHVTGFILAAGLGTRLKPLTDHIPKALVPVCGVPLLGHAHRFLSGSGIHKIGANTHHLAPLVHALCESLEFPVELFHETGRIRGTGGALHFARDYLSQDSLFCIVNVDIISTADLQRLADAFDSSGCACGLVAAAALGKGTLAYDPSSGDYLGTVSNGALPQGAESADFIGISLYRREILDLVTADDFSVLPIWDRARDRGAGVKVFVQESMYWSDIGTPRSLAQVHFDVFDGACELDIGNTTYVDWQNKRAYPSALQAGARDALGPYTWCNSLDIETGARLHHAVVLEGARVGRDAEVSNTIVTPWGDLHIG
ncbi:MAG: NTP transferase domain-containing protein [Chitinivibrionales bacterium]|nr:NTP transferase domain-containing protein [Chitinivibrionales bacterium]MBD3395443.1 NTP transferase domain-containing protein [Chitinivibrionales bacterium]